jgi:hypothetical protein
MVGPVFCHNEKQVSHTNALSLCAKMTETELYNLDKDVGERNDLGTSGARKNP